MSDIFYSGTFIGDTEANTILDYNSFPVSKKPVQTTALFNQLIESLKLQQTGTGTFMTKGDGDSISTALSSKAPLANPSFSGTVSGITKAMVSLGNVDNTSDASKPVSTAQQTALDLKAPLLNPSFSGTVSGVTKAMVSLGNVDNTSDASKPVSTAQQTALDLKAPLLNPSFSGTVSGVTKAMVGLANCDNTSDASKPVSTAQQTALDLKAPLLNPSFSGTVSGVTKAMVGLGNCDNTSDANKSISTATQSALDLKAPLLNPSFSSDVTIGDTLSDTLSIHSTTVVNGVSLTPTQISKVQHLDVSSSVTNLINAKTTLSGIQNNGNVWTSTNSFDNYLPTSILTPSSNTQLTTKSYVDTQISNLVNSSPENLNTLNELANALGQDANFSTTMTTLIGTKAGLTSNNSMSGVNTFSSLPLTASELTPSDNKHLTPKKWCDDTFVKLGSNNTLTGVQNFNNNVVIGDGVGGDVMTINCNILTNTYTLTPANLAKVRFISDISSSISSQLASKASLANANTFSGSQTYNGTCEFANNIIANAVTISPQQLSKLQYLNVSSAVQETLDTIATKCSLTNDNTITGVNVFSQIPQIANANTYPVSDNQYIHYKFANEKYVKLDAGQNVMVVDLNMNNKTVLVSNGDLSFYDNTNVINVGLGSVVVSQLLKLNYVDISSSVTTLLSNKGSIGSANAWTSTNTFNSYLPTSTLTPTSDTMLTTKAYVDTKSSLGSNNVYTGTNTFSNDVSVRDIFLQSASNATRTIQWYDTEYNPMGLIETDVSTKEMSFKTPQTKDFKFVSGSTVVAKINKTGTPADATDLCPKSYVDKGICLPSVFTYGNNAQTTSAMDLTGGQIFLNFTTSRVIQNVSFELSYHVNYSNQNSMNINTTHYNFVAIYNLVYSTSNNAYYLRLSDGSATILNVSSSLKPWQLGLSGGRISLVYQLLATGANNNPSNGAWISSFSIGCRLLNSYTGGNRFLSPNANSSSGSDVGNCYLSLT